MIIREVYSLEKDDNILKYALCNNKENLTVICRKLKNNRAHLNVENYMKLIIKEIILIQ